MQRREGGEAAFKLSNGTVALAPALIIELLHSPLVHFRDIGKSRVNDAQAMDPTVASFTVKGLAAATFTPYHEDGSIAPELVDAHCADLAKNKVSAAFSEYGTVPPRGNPSSLAFDGIACVQSTERRETA